MPTTLNSDIPAEFAPLTQWVAPADVFVEAPRLQVIEILSYIYTSCQTLLAHMNRESQTSDCPTQIFVEIQTTAFMLGVLERRALDYLSIVLAGSEEPSKARGREGERRLPTSLNVGHNHDNLAYSDLLEKVKKRHTGLPSRSPFHSETVEFSEASNRQVATLVRGFKELLVTLLRDIPWKKRDPEEQTHGDFLHRNFSEVRAAAQRRIKELLQAVDLKGAGFTLGSSPLRIMHDKTTVPTK